MWEWIAIGCVYIGVGYITLMGLRRNALARATVLSWLLCATGAAIFGVIYLLTGNSANGVAHLVASVYCLIRAWLRYRKWKDKKKIRTLIGEKSRVLLAAVADSARKLADGVRNPLPGIQPAPAR